MNAELEIINRFLDSLSPYEDSEGNWPCYSMDEEELSKARQALDKLLSEKPSGEAQ